MLLCRSFADQIADDYEASGDPDSRSKLNGLDIEPTNGVDHAEPRPDRALGIILMRPRIAEIDEHAVAHIFGDKAIEPADHLGDCAVICSDDLAQILGIEPRRERRRADQIAEHHRQLPAFGFRPHPCLRRDPRVEPGEGREGEEAAVGGRDWQGRGLRHIGRANGGNRGKELAAVADRTHPDADQVLRRQLRQNLGIDIVVAEGGLVSPQSQAAQPRRYVHQAPASSSSSAFACFRSGVSKPSVNHP